jgi:predicted extracellular nuclease/Ca2+-binding RTX toxin-like protein
MKMKPPALRNGTQTWSDLADSLKVDSWSVFGQRGDAQAETGAGPQAAQAPDPGGALVPPTISLTGAGVTYTQNFDTLSNTAGSTTNVLTIDGWSMTETGGGARDNEQYAVDTGSSTTGDTFSYGATAATDRALGELRSGTLVPNFGAAFTNNTGATITQLLISYTGEQWRFGGVHSTVPDRLDFQYNLTAADLTTVAGWVDVNQLDFNPPVVTGTASALDGNVASTVITFTITGLSIASGTTFWVRWQDIDATGADDGLAIDNFNLTANPPGVLSINDVSHVEGDSGTTLYTFTVTRASGTVGAVGATWTLNAPGGGTNADSADFIPTQALTGSVSFADGETSKTITIEVQADDVVESDETFTVTLSAATGGATLGDASGLGTITNDDNAGTLAINDVTLAEGDSGSTAFTFTVLRTLGDDGTVTADYTITLPGGVGGADSGDIVGGQLLTGTISFADGETSRTITLNISGDTTFEPGETFTVALANPTGGVTITDGSGTGTITNDDAAPLPFVSVADASVVELDSGNNEMVFIVTLSEAPTSGTISVDFTTADGSAFALEDYTSTSGQVVFGVGETSKEIHVPVFGDTTFEPDETFTVTLSSPSGAIISDGVATGTIINNDPTAGSVAIADASIIEGETGTTILQLTVTRSGGTLPFSVDFATSNGGNPNNASATAGSDYVAQNGTLSFATGQNSATIDIVINGDDVDELSEEFTVTLSNATGDAVIGDATAIGTITSDDTGPAGPTGVWINEFHYDNAGTDAGEFIEIAAQAGTNLAGYSLVLYNGNGGASYQTINLSGTIANQAGGYGALQFAAVDLQNGAPDGIALVGPGGVIEFISYEGTMTAGNGPAVGMTSTDVGVSEPGTANGTSIGRVGGPGSAWVLFSDDSPGQLNAGQLLGPTPTIAVSDVSVNEAAGTMTFTVTRTNVAPVAFTVDYATANGTATAGSDYGAASGTLIFTANQLQALVTVTISNDGAAEFDETLFFNLSNATNGAVISDNQAVGTIVNDDGTPISVSIGDVIQAEGTSGTTLFTFTVARSGGTGAFDIDFATANGSATVAGNDYLANSGTLNFGVGEMFKTISVTVNGDVTPEPVENFFVNLTNATNNVIVTDASGTGTILDGSGTLNFIHDIQGTSYFSPILAGEGITNFNQASAGFVTVQAIITAVDNDGSRQGFYIQEQVTDWDGNNFTSEGIFVMTRNDAGVGTAVSGVAVGDLVTVSAQVMEYQGFSTNMPITALVNPSAIVVNSTGNSLPTLLLDAGHPIPNAILTGVTPDYTDSADGVGDTFDASLYALSFFETVEGMLVTIPDMVAADGFVSTSGGQPYFQAYSTVHANADQINSRGGYTIAGDPPLAPPNTPETEDDTIRDGRHVHDGDINPDIIEVDFTGFAIDAPAGLTANLTMGDAIGDITGIIEFDHSDRKLFVTAVEPGGFVNGVPAHETTLLGDDDRALTVATFNVENLDPGDGAARFTALANAMANNLNAPDIICIEEMQDNNGATNDGTTDASNTWQSLVNALNLATGAHYQWVDQAPVNNAEGGEPGGNIRVGFLYNTDRVQLGDLDANATLTERRMYTDRIGDGVRDAGDLIAFSDDMIAGEINGADWTTTRKSLVGEFTFHGNTVYAIANHWPSKGGSDDIWEFDQNIDTGNPTNSDWSQRSQVGQDVYAMLNLIQAGAPDAGIVSGGDYNDFYFYRPLTTVTGYTMADGTARVGGARFDNLTITELSEAERYTYAFDGRSQAIDHVIVNSTLSGVASYDIVHLNTGYNTRGTGPDASPALSDHDPALSSFDFREFSEILVGTSGSDSINGFGGNDMISGLAGDDFLDGGTGVDTLAGGTNDDTYIVDNAADTVIELSGEGRDVVYARVSYALATGSSVEVLSTAALGATTAINLTGNELGNILYGNAGANILNGAGGADYMAGLGGDDDYYVDTLGDYVAENAGGGRDVVYASASYALAAGASVEVLSTIALGETTAIDLTGNELANLIVGNAGANVLNGGRGADYLAGFGGDDTYYVDNAGDYTAEDAGGGRDVVYASTSYTLTAGESIEVLSTVGLGETTAIDLTGNGFGNLILGNAGANVLNGGGGSDYLVGLGGADSFAFTTALGSGNVDTLADFSAVDDVILLDDAIFAALAAGALNSNAFVIGSAALDADDRIIYNNATGQIFYDADGNGAGAQVHFATLNGAPPITAADFIVI